MIRGSIVALITPLHADGSLDWDALDALVEWHIEQGTHGIAAVGTTGESATLTMEEHKAVVKRVVERVQKRVPVIAGTGANSTSEALELTQSAKEAGADACLLVTPYYNKPTQEGLYLHHKTIAEAVDIPQILYNVPGRTAVDMKTDTVARLAALPNIIGIKDATGSIARAEELLAAVPNDFILLSGDDDTALEFLRVGGHGEISVTANVVPAQTARMCDLMRDGQYEEAQAVNAEIAALHTTLFLESNPIPVKWALAEMGKCSHAIRLPLTVLSEQYHQTLRDALKTSGAL